MKTSKEIRIANLKKLISQFGSINKLSEAVEKSPAQISHMKHGKYFGDKVARDIEVALGIEHGLLDNENYGEEPAIDSLLSQIATMFESNQISIEERKFLQFYRMLNNKDKKTLLDLAKTLSKNET